MRITLVLILIILLVSNQSKASELTIELIPDSATIGINFSCLRVIDARDNKDNIGFVTRGLKKNDARVIFPSEFKEYLELTINKILPENINNPKLVLLFRNIIVSENIGTMNQYGYCNVEVEFARQTDTLLYSLGVFHSSIIENSNTVKYSHGKRVLQALGECFRKFDKSNWKTNEGILIQNIDSNILFDYKTVPPKGVYLNYSQMIRRVPTDSNNIDIKELKKNKFISYEIDFKNDINPELVQFVSDGNSLYIHANSKQYLKSREFGKYIYFQGQFPTSSNSDQTIFLMGVGAGLAGGLVGGLFFSLAMDASNTNNAVKGVVLNTEKGIIKILTDYYLVEIARDFPELLKEYRNSKRDLVDKENLIIKLNSKF